MSTEKARQTWARVANAYCVQSLCALVCLFFCCRRLVRGDACFFFFERYKYGLNTLVVETVFAKYRDHGDLRRDTLQCSVDRRSSWPFPRQTLAKDLEGYKKLVKDMV